MIKAFSSWPFAGLFFAFIAEYCILENKLGCLLCKTYFTVAKNDLRFLPYVKSNKQYASQVQGKMAQSLSLLSRRGICLPSPNPTTNKGTLKMDFPRSWSRSQLMNEKVVVSREPT